MKRMERIDIPYKFKLREYQERVWEKYFHDGIRHFCLVWHRRAGKSKLAVNIIAAASQMRVGAYYYFFPYLTQAKAAIWDGRGSDGIKFVDHFPPELIQKVNNADMKIYFKNGSIFQLRGTDGESYNKTTGSNPVMILMDEFAQMTPQARGYFIPVLAENDGCEIIISTPRGENHFYDLYNNVRDDPEWYTSKLTVEDTFTGTGAPVVEQKDIDFYRKSGWSHDKINQEMYCSFTASTDGAYFADQMKEALDSDRICDFGIDTSIPVSTYWDLGISKDDAMSIWLVQKKNDQFYCIAYHEDHNHGIGHYINWLRDFRDRHGLVFDQHFGPHDIVNRHHSTGKSTRDIAMELGFVFRRVPRVQKKEVAIDLARMIIPRCVFHKTKASQGIACLRDYHKKYDEEKRIYRHVHNWASHGADAFMTLAQSQNEKSNSSMNVSSFNVLQGFG